MSNDPAANPSEAPLTRTIASFISETPASRISAATLASAKYMFLDTFGCVLAASDRRLGRLIAAYAAEEDDRATSTIIGSGRKVSAAAACLANGAMAHALALEGGNHLPTHVLPVALALAEKNGLSGADVLDAAIIGFEVGSKITHALGRGPTQRGWWHPGLVGPLAAAATAARALRLGAPETAMALGIASCGSGGFRRNMGTMSQALHSGLAARDGLQAADLASRGFTADPAILESPLGFFAALRGDAESSATAAGWRLGDPFALESGYAIKPFPVCGPAQPLVEAILRLRARAEFTPEEIAGIETDLQFFSLLRPEPTDEDSAGYSGAFAIAAALLFGTVWIEHVTDQAVRDPRVRALMARVRHVAGADRVTIRLSGGRLLDEAIAPSRRADSPGIAEEKFRRCAGKVLPDQTVARLEEMILGLERLSRIDELMALTGTATGSAHGQSTKPVQA